MKKLNEYSRKYVEVEKVKVIFRSSDNVAYSVYKDRNNNYYIDAFDGAYSVAKLSGEFANDSDAVVKAQQLINKDND